MTTEQIQKEIVRTVKGAKGDIGISLRELSAKCGMSHQTYCSRMNHPEQLTLKECWALEDALKLKRGAIAGIGKEPKREECIAMLAKIGIIRMEVTA